jgi:hypothetical protein
MLELYGRGRRGGVEVGDAFSQTRRATCAWAANTAPVYVRHSSRSPTMDGCVVHYAVNQAGIQGDEYRTLGAGGRQHANHLALQFGLTKHDQLGARILGVVIMPSGT